MTSDNIDIVDLDRRAVDLSMRLVSQATGTDLDRPTPCSPWRLGDLLEHMTVQHYGFAAASRGQGADPRSWQLATWLGDPSGATGSGGTGSGGTGSDDAASGDAVSRDAVSDYVSAAQQVLAAFAEPGVGERPFVLPEISPSFEFPGAQAISFHFVDYVMHGWDVARALNIPYEVDDEVAAVALQVAQRVPDGPARLTPGSAFLPSIQAASGASDLDRALAALGRSPGWPA